MTLCAPLIHGYHPYAEDGGIYLAGIKYCLHPGLYPSNTGFVSAHVQFSLFAHAVALLARAYPPALMGILFALYLLTIFFTLFAAGQVAQQLTNNVSAQRWAVTLLAASLTVPVAGTSLMLMDPYVTARSVAFPCVVAAFAAALRLCSHSSYKRESSIIALCLLAAITLHPLSGGYGAGAIAMLFAMRQRTLWSRCMSMALVTLCTLAACVTLRLAWNNVPPGYNVIAHSRTYWALSNWTWYELAGVVAPVLLLMFVAPSRTLTATGRVFARAMAAAGLLSSAISLLFVHAHGPNFAVARVQPLRVFQYLYLALPLCLGAWLASRMTRTLSRTALCLCIAGAMFLTQRNIYPSSNHVEWPGVSPANQWQQAFLWIRHNTPVDAAIAIDAHYITARGEDAQNIRSITERSTPADVSKDGGITAIRPALTPAWYDGVALQRDLASISDNERVQRLSARGIDWLVLPTTSNTKLPCPYRNGTVAVCRVIAPQDFVRRAK